MNAEKIAQNAIQHTEAFADVLTTTVRRELAYAQVARWLATQDESVLATAAETAVAAFAIIAAAQF